MMDTSGWDLAEVTSHMSGNPEFSWTPGTLTKPPPSAKVPGPAGQPGAPRSPLDWLLPTHFQPRYLSS